MEKKNSTKKEKPSKAVRQGRTPPRMTFSETVRINIGDYENRDLFVSYSDDIQDGETSDDCFIRLKTSVRKKLYAAERRHRMASRESVDFDTKAKIQDKKG